MNNLTRFLDRDEFLTPFDKIFDKMMVQQFPEFTKEVGIDFFYAGSYPKVDAMEFSDRVVIEAEIPGLKKEDNLEKRNVIIYVVLDFIRKISILLQPVIPEKTKIILDSLNIDENERFIKNVNKNYRLKLNTKIQKINILFKKQW